MAAAPAAPERSLNQRREALVRANKIRTARAQGKQILKQDRAWTTLIDLIVDLEPPNADDGATADDYLTMKVYDALTSTKGLGPTKAALILRQTRISPSKTLGGLTIRQRRELGLELGLHSERRVRERNDRLTGTRERRRRRPTETEERIAAGAWA